MIKNTAGQKIGCQMTTLADGSAFTGSVTVYVTGDAGTQAVGSVGAGACTDEGNGYYTYAPAQAETNYDLVAFTFTGTGAKTETVQVFTVAGTVAQEASVQAVAAQISGIGTAGGAAINLDCATDNVLGPISGVTSGTTFLGTQSSGTYANTSNVNNVYHTITGTASGNTAMDVVYQFLTGSGTKPVEALWIGYVTSNNDIITISAWRHDTNEWEFLTTITGTTATTKQTINITLYDRHRGTSAAELGKVYIRLHCTGMTTPVVATDQLKVSYSVTSRGTYSDGAVWLNTNASNTNTQSYVDGMPENPVSTIAAAITIADNLKLRRIRVANGSSITFSASMANRTLIGKNWTCALGGQAIDGAYIEGAEVSGTGTCTTQAEFAECHINAGAITGPARFNHCGFQGSSGSPFTAGSAGEFVFMDCFSEVAGSGTPYFTLSGAGGFNFRRWSGGSNITLNNSSATITMEVVTGGGQTIATAGANVELRGICRAVTLTGIATGATCQINAVTGPVSLAGSDGTVNIYGVCGVVTDSRTGSPILTNKAVSRDNVNIEVDTALADVGITSTRGGYLDNLSGGAVALDSTVMKAASYTAPLSASGTRTALGLANANLDTQLGDIPTNSELATALAGADDAVLAAISGLNNLSSAGAQAAAAAALAAYTAAKTSDLDTGVNVTKVAGVTLGGTGTTEDPWGPA